MTRNDKLILSAPLLVALYDPVQLAVHNAGEFTAMEFFVGVLAAVALGAGIALLAWLLFRRRSVFAAGLVACVWIAWLLVGGSFAASLDAPFVDTLAPSDGVWLLAAAALVLTSLIVRGQSPRRDALRGVAIAMAGIVAWDAGAIALESIRSASTPATPAGRVTLTRTAVPRDSLPDIYIIILDQYASAHVQRALFGHDITPFLDSLRARGFTLPAHAFTNYTITVRSVNSMLNMTPLADLMRESGIPSSSSAKSYEIMRANRTFALARAHGYRVMLVPSWDFPGTESSPLADVTWKLGGSDGGLAVFLGRQYPATLLARTPFGFLLLERRGVAVSPEIALSPFRGVQRFAREPGPKFVFAHTMVTHTPYLFDAMCRPERAVTAHAAGANAAYVNAVECANRQVLATVDTIRAHATRPVVIVLQGDHGTATLGPTEIRGGVTQADETHGALSAFLLPDARALPDTVTPVNIIPIIFNRYLGDSLPKHPDEAFDIPPHGKPPFRVVVVDPYPY